MITHQLKVLRVSMKITPPRILEKALKRDCPVGKTFSNFTLVELLVVITIIAILAGILLPTLNQAKAKSRAISCFNSLKTLGTGMQLYGMEEGVCAPIHETNSTISWYTNETFFGMMGMGASQYQASKKWYWRPGNLCPDARNSDDTLNPEKWRRIDWTYGIAFEGTTPLANASGTESWRPQKMIHLSLVRKPSERYLFGEVADMARLTALGNCANPARPRGWWEQGNNLPLGDWVPLVAYRHANLKNANFAYLDGHVASLPYNEVMLKTRRFYPYNAD